MEKLWKVKCISILALDGHIYPSGGSGTGMNWRIKFHQIGESNSINEIRAKGVDVHMLVPVAARDVGG